MARPMAAAMAGCFWGALLGAAPVHAESHAADPQVACVPAAGELVGRDRKLGQWAAALDFLSAVAPEHRSAGDWLCLARAQTRLGSWIEALDSYDELAERTFKTPAERALRQLGAQERRELEQHLAWIQIMPSAPLQTGTRVTLDGDPIARARIGVEFPVMPGRRTLGIESPRGTTPLPALDLAEGEHRVVALVLQPASMAEPAPTPVAPSHGASAAATNERALVWTRRALYVGAIATTGGLVSMATGSPALQGFGIGSAVVGGISFLTATLLPLVSGLPDEDSHPDSTARRIEPWVGMTSAGVSGSF